MRYPNFHNADRAKFKLILAILAFTIYLFLSTSPVSAVRSIILIGKMDDDRQTRPMTLGANGRRGQGLLFHQKHESLITPDPNSPHTPTTGVACTGCHHTVKQVTDAEQFQKCSACHKGEGDADNPDDKEGYDLNAREIFHRSCIGCHRA